MQSEIAAASPLGPICVVFESRPDGGLRVYSDDVPGFMLSHPNRARVMDDIVPALETIIGEMLHKPVKVSAVGETKSLPWFARDERETQQYEALLAA